MMRDLLKDFVNEELVIGLYPDRWSRLDAEIAIPVGKGIAVCAMRIGVYGGKAGQARFRKPIFREARSVLKADISGTGWTELRVVGAVPETVKLEPNKKLQSTSVVLPKALCLYKVELIGTGIRKVIREVAND